MLFSSYQLIFAFSPLAFAGYFGLRLFAGKSALLKRFPPDLNRRDSQRVKDERIFVH